MPELFRNAFVTQEDVIHALVRVMLISSVLATVSMQSRISMVRVILSNLFLLDVLNRTLAQALRSKSDFSEATWYTRTSPAS